MHNKAAVFILLGQSNAVGHNLPMQESDIIRTPLKNVFGLSRKKNQAFDNTSLIWSGYTSTDMNLAEEQDNTYSIANCLAKCWQEYIDNGNARKLPDLYIVHIAIGGQGVTEEYMWHPKREKRLVPGPLGTVDISLFPFSRHILGLLEKSFVKAEKEYEIIGLHWRGGENDVTATNSELEHSLNQIYTEIFDEFNRLLHFPPLVLHKIVCPDRMMDMDGSGEYLKNMHHINAVFEDLQNRYPTISLFDPRKFPHYTPNVRGNGIFLDDAVHFTKDVNEWVASCIIEDYFSTHSCYL